VGSDGVDSDGLGSDEVASDGIDVSDVVGSDGVESDGVGSDGVESDGVGSDRVGSDGVDSDGVDSDGVGSDGVGSDGVGSDGVDSDGVDSDGVDMDMDMDVLIDMSSARIRLQNMVSSGKRKSDGSRRILRWLSSSPISIRRRSAPTMAMTLKKRYLILVLLSSRGRPHHQKAQTNKYLQPYIKSCHIA
jgi:hypothetical protein